MTHGDIVKVAGPLVVARGLTNPQMYELVRVGEASLFGEIIELRGDLASIQVYEETSGIGPGEPVVQTGTSLTVELGPGLITSIYDGIQRPLDALLLQYGDFIPRGVSLPALPRDKAWHFHPLVREGDAVEEGDLLGFVDETTAVTHRIMMPKGRAGTVTAIAEGNYTIDQGIATVRDASGKEEAVTMLQKWPVRTSRPFARRLPPETPLVTGQRVIDALFPVAKGGTACVPGPFGSGKTVIQHQLAKWSDADIIVYVGCGERGNEMTDVLQEFPRLKDPKTGEVLMNRTVLIANTSNMPVAAREASVFTGITIAEYFRDMGYSVALMADSTSRWAEAMREISGRLEEMPGEEGYPAYLASRIASFYERAGRVMSLGSPPREGSLSVIGAVSPPGGDLSEPVVQSTLRAVKVFWALDSRLAYARHFPAIDWLQSYSLYPDSLAGYYSQNLGERWIPQIQEARTVLQKEAELQELVRLVGVDALSSVDRLTLEWAKSIREDFLQQSAFSDTDSYTSLGKQLRMLDAIMLFAHLAQEATAQGVPLDRVLSLPIRVDIARSKAIDESSMKGFDTLEASIRAGFADLLKESVDVEEYRE
ncbi:MAG: V-type ATP synthase subunit A [Caldisericota bacterium]|jgi:V/A-type H+-transporting ATPase subunit A|nr:V-type ATP synthase subunit A [Caldisericota bacterium]